MKRAGVTRARFISFSCGRTSLVVQSVADTARKWEWIRRSRIQAPQKLRLVSFNHPLVVTGRRNVIALIYPQPETGRRWHAELDPLVHPTQKLIGRGGRPIRDELVVSGEHERQERKSVVRDKSGRGGR